MNKLFIVFAIIFIGAISAFAQTKGAINKTTMNTTTDALAEAKSAIDKGNAQWTEAWAKGDPVMVAELFAEDGKFLSASGKVIKGRQQILDRYKAAMQGIGKEIKNMKVSATSVNVWLDGDTAYETGKYSYNYEENGKPIVEAGKYVTIWKRQKDGSWKLFMDMGVPQD